MSANTSFATTNATLIQFIAKQKLTNGTIVSDLSSTEYPITTILPLNVQRFDNIRSTTITINPGNSFQNGYISSADWNTFNSKLSSIVAGPNIYVTNGATPTISLSISSSLDMSSQSIINLASEDYKTNIDIRQAGNQRIYTSGANSDMYINPQGNLRILRDISLNGNNRLDMVSGVITGISNENYTTNIDIRQAGNKRIYTSGANMILDPQGNLDIKADISLNSNNLDLGNGKLINVRDQDFQNNVIISQAGVNRIYTTGTTNMRLDAPGYLYISTDVSMNGKTIDMGGGSLKNNTFTDMSLNGNTLDMSGGVITRVGSERFSTNIDIRQGTTQRIYTTGANSDMIIDPSGNLQIISDVSLNGNTLDMSGGAITRLGSQSFPTNIDIRQGTTQRIYTSGANSDMFIDPSGNLQILSDMSLNGTTLDMNGGAITRVGSQSFPTNIDIRQGITPRIYTTGTNMFMDSAGYLSILSDVSMNGNTLDMSGGKCVDVSEIYGLVNKNLRIDASSITFTNNLNTHMLIDNCGITLNDISYSNTGTVLSYNTTNKRVHYVPLYDTSSYTFGLVGGSGTTVHSYTMTFNKVVNMITLNIPDASCVIDGLAPDAVVDFSFGSGITIDTKFIPNASINFPAIVYETTAVPSTAYYSGVITIGSNGTIKLYKAFNKTDTWGSTNKAGMLSQCFTYTV
jgi:hypothetical protein